MDSRPEDSKPQPMRGKAPSSNPRNGAAGGAYQLPVSVVAIVGSLGTAQEKSHQALALTSLLRQAVAMAPAGDQTPLNCEGIELVLQQVEQGLQAALGALNESVCLARTLGQKADATQH